VNLVHDEHDLLVDLCFAQAQLIIENGEKEADVDSLRCKWWMARATHDFRKAVREKVRSDVARLCESSFANANRAREYLVDRAPGGMVQDIGKVLLLCADPKEKLAECCSTQEQKVQYLEQAFKTLVDGWELGKDQGFDWGGKVVGVYAKLEAEANQMRGLSEGARRIVETCRQLDPEWADRVKRAGPR